jgi:hypothetical protein
MNGVNVVSLQASAHDHELIKQRSFLELSLSFT